MVKYLEKFPPFGLGQQLPVNMILNLVEFSLPKECQKEPIIQWLNLPPKASQILLSYASALVLPRKCFGRRVKEIAKPLSRCREKGQTRTYTP